ncbi:MAG: DsbA family protein [Rhodobacteraceae bacterium]|nr:DsbA family protein [Paracoccaceae bacterium]
MTQFAAALRVLPLSLMTAALLAIQTGSTEAQDRPEYIEMALGNPDAKVEMIEYASFTCPHCANFHHDVFPKIKENYIDTGQVHYRVREVFHNRPGLWAAILARCGGPERYFGISDLLYNRQQSWANSDSAAHIIQRLEEIGRAAGLSDQQINGCFTDAEGAKLLFDASNGFSEADGVTSTPSFVINGELHSNAPYESLAAILDEALTE